MARFLDHLRHDHRRFEALLAFLDGVVQHTDSLDAVDFTELSEAVACLQPGVSGNHCAVERVVWNRLAEQTGSPRLVIEVLRFLHQSVVEKGDRLESVLLAGREGTPVRLAELKYLADTFVAEFRGQIALEERAVFPLLEGVLRDEDWQAIEHRVSGNSVGEANDPTPAPG